jgi:hypothetical protein
MQVALASLSTASLRFLQSVGGPKEDQIQGLGFLVAAGAVAAAAVAAAGRSNPGDIAGGGYGTEILVAMLDQDLLTTLVAAMTTTTMILLLLYIRLLLLYIRLLLLIYTSRSCIYDSRSCNCVSNRYL